MRKRYEDFKSPSEYLENALNTWDAYYSSNGGMYKAISSLLEENKKLKEELAKDFYEKSKGNSIIKFVVPSDVYSKFEDSLKSTGLSTGEMLSAFVDLWTEKNEHPGSM